MRTEEAVEIFGTKNALAEAIGISPSAVYQWGDDIPVSRIKSVQLAIQAKADDLEREAKSLRSMSQGGGL